MRTVLRKVRNLHSLRSTALILVSSFVASVNTSHAQSGTKCFSTTPQGGCQSCNLRYPDNSNLPRSAVDFNESEVLAAWEPGSMSCNAAPTQIKLWYTDERALLLGVRRVIVKTASGTTTTDYDVTPTPASPTGVTNPKVGTTIQTGDQTGNDEADGGGRPIWPVLYLTDITNNPSSRSGDWQQGGTGHAPTKIYGIWKAAVRTVDKTKSPAVVTIDPDDDPTANGTNLGGGDALPSGIKAEKFTAEVIWDVSSLGLQPGHSYRIQFMVHDGDQNKTGGDVGQACTTVVMPPVNPVPTPAPAPVAKLTWDYDINTNTYSFITKLSKDFNNNTYGTNAIGWPGGHTFNNLTDDRLEMVLTNGEGKEVLDFTLDYLSQNGNMPSGYGAMGISGGNGNVITGDKKFILSSRTSLSENLNTYNYVLTTNSPKTDNNYTTNNTYKNWIYDVWYEVIVDAQVFKDKGFGSVTIPYVYAGGSKTGTNLNPVYEVPCPLQNVTLGGKVFNDRNDDGLFNGTDTVMGNVTVKLYKDTNGDNVADGPAMATTTSAKDGTYSFTGLPDGKYIIGAVTTGGFGRGGVVTSGGKPDNNIIGDNNGVNNVAGSPEVRTNFKTVAGGKEPLDGGYSNFTIDIGLFKSTIPLPITLVQFNGSTNGNNSELAWRIANESNVLSYVVERSTDGANFASSGAVNSLGANSEQRYSFTDANSANNAVVYYRLKIVAYDGSISYSNIIQLKFGSVKNSLLLYPNPANGYMVLNIGVEKRSNAVIRLVNSLGQMVSSKTVTLNAGSNAITFDGLSQFVNGMYRVSVHLENGEEMGQTLLLAH